MRLASGMASGSGPRGFGQRRSDDARHAFDLGSKRETWAENLACPLGPALSDGRRSRVAAGERPFAAGPHHDAYVCMVESEDRPEAGTTAGSIIVALRGGANA
jgi:hypothetical protein